MGHMAERLKKFGRGMRWVGVCFNPLITVNVDPGLNAITAGSLPRVPAGRYSC